MARSHFLFSSMRSCREAEEVEKTLLSGEKTRGALTVERTEERGQDEEGMMTEQMSLKQKSFVDFSQEEKQTEQHDVTSQKTLKKHTESL